MITDLGGFPLTSAMLDIQSNQERLLSIKIDCLAGYFLRCATVPEIQVSARHEDSPDFTDLESDGLDLTAWQDLRETFQIKLSVGEISEIKELVFDLTVSQ